MFRWIRRKEGSSGFYLDNPPPIFPKNTPEPLSFQLVLRMASFITASYANRHDSDRTLFLPIHLAFRSLPFTAFGCDGAGVPNRHFGEGCLSAASSLAILFGA